jgi:hypothetical protein
MTDEVVNLAMIQRQRAHDAAVEAEKLVWEERFLGLLLRDPRWGDCPQTYAMASFIGWVCADELDRAGQIMVGKKAAN